MYTFACSSIFPFARPGGLLFRFDFKSRFRYSSKFRLRLQVWQMEHFDKIWTGFPLGGNFSPSIHRFKSQFHHPRKYLRLPFWLIFWCPGIYFPTSSKQQRRSADTLVLSVFEEWTPSASNIRQPYGSACRFQTRIGCAILLPDESRAQTEVSADPDNNLSNIFWSALPHAATNDGNFRQDDLPCLRFSAVEVLIFFQLLIHFPTVMGWAPTISPISV